MIKKVGDLRAIESLSIRSFKCRVSIIYQHPVLCIGNKESIKMSTTKLTHQQKLDIFYEIEHEFDIEDITRQIEDLCNYYSDTNKGKMLRNLTVSDIECIATQYRENHDSNLADNDQRENVIKHYISEHFK